MPSYIRNLFRLYFSSYQCVKLLRSHSHSKKICLVETLLLKKSSVGQSNAVIRSHSAQFNASHPFKVCWKKYNPFFPFILATMDEGKQQQQQTTTSATASNNYSSSNNNTSNRQTTTATTTLNNDYNLQRPKLQTYLCTTTPKARTRAPIAKLHKTELSVSTDKICGSGGQRNESATLVNWPLLVIIINLCWFNCNKNSYGRKLQSKHSCFTI